MGTPIERNWCVRPGVTHRRFRPGCRRRTRAASASPPRRRHRRSHTGRRPCRTGAAQRQPGGSCRLAASQVPFRAPRLADGSCPRAGAGSLGSRSARDQEARPDDGRSHRLGDPACGESLEAQAGKREASEPCLRSYGGGWTGSPVCSSTLARCRARRAEAEQRLNSGVLKMGKPGSSVCENAPKNGPKTTKNSRKYYPKLRRSPGRWPAALGGPPAALPGRET